MLHPRQKSCLELLSLLCHLPSVCDHRNSYSAFLPVRCPFSDFEFVDNPLILFMASLLIDDALHEVESRDM